MTPHAGPHVTPVTLSELLGGAVRAATRHVEEGSRTNALRALESRGAAEAEASRVVAVLERMPRQPRVRPRITA